MSVIKHIHNLKDSFVAKSRFFNVYDSLFFTLMPYTKTGYSRKHKRILAYLDKNFHQILSSYNAKNQSLIAENSPVWVLWYQGLDKAPEIVNMCIASIRKNSGQHNVIFLDKNNIKDYLILPQYVLDKVKKGYITLTHFSDIIRMGLLSQYGGFWIDSTIFVNEEIKSYKTPFYSIKQNVQYPRFVLEGNKWTAFFIATGPHNEIAKFVYDLFLEYWKHNNLLIDYNLIDYALALAYLNFKDFHEIIDDNVMDNPNVYYLYKVLTHENSLVHLDVIKSIKYSKLNWRLNLKENSILKKLI